MLLHLRLDSGLCPSLHMQQNDQFDDRIEHLITRYYFDMATEQCYPFGTQSCGGNANRFETLSDCQLYCKQRKR